MVWDVIARVLCQESIAQLQPSKGFSTTTLMRIVASLDSRVNGSLHVSEENIGVSRVSMEILSKF